MTTSRPSHQLFIVSGSIGTAGERIARKVMSQFREADLDLTMISHVKNEAQIDTLLDNVQQVNGTIVQTLVNPSLNAYLKQQAATRRIYVVDVVSDLMFRLRDVLGQSPTGKPGLYRDLHADYFRRIEALEYTMAHDDGVSYQDWHNAEIILTGVSRVGKTPLSIYLGMLGWRVANAPIVPGVPPRPELFEVERHRVIGLMIDPSQLVHHRHHRQANLGMGKSDYYDLTKLYEELDEAKKVFRKGGFRVLDVTNKPIEASADKIVHWITR